MQMRQIPLLLLTSVLAACAAHAPRQAAVTTPEGSRAALTLLETTDVHSNVLSFDYYKSKPDPGIGYERVATLIDRARAEYPNTLLFDAGDTIQGTVLADYQAQIEPLACDDELAIYKAMDAMGYDGAAAGNHEFNYGLPFLSQVTGTPMNVDGVDTDRRCAGPNFPIVLSNVFSARDGQPIFAPWTVISRTLQATAPDGRAIEAPLRVGLIGFTPPPILEWDKRNLEGRVTVMGIVEAARKYLPEIQAQHPDLIIAILHSGLSTRPYSEQLENAAWYVADIPGIDALLMGHSHKSFPGPFYADLPDVDAERGTVKGVPAVMANFFGHDLGLIHLALEYRDGRWVSRRDEARSEVQPVCPTPDTCVPPEPRIAPLVQAVHDATVAYVDTPIGRTDLHLSTYFADAGDTSALGVVNAAQRDYVRQWIAEERPDLADIPVLGAAAAFRTGFGGPTDYTDVAAGPLTIRNAADLYFYPNTLAAVKVDGAGLKAWLETAARRFNRIDPASTEPQPLIDSRFPGYNFDQIQGGIDYVIDVSKPAGSRITELRFDGRPVDPAQPFIVVTNNYRASGGGSFPGLDGSNTVLMAPDGNREILVDWLRRHPELHRDNLPARSWRFAPLATRAPVTLESASGKLDVAREAGLGNIRLLSELGDGTSLYAVDLAHP